ncbi:penicillin-binding protein, beta-lactamase class C [Burkholderiales bacterium JOSHI_001]|nr:penicillin-binding protein, beta-lactamase class C [Burkholderiales bacterium JOSHI_001]
MPTPASQPLALATAFAEAHETPWTRDPLREPQRFGVHHEDPPPWNRLRGPVHPRGPCSGVVWQRGVEIASWGQPGRSDQTFSVAKTCLALLAGVAQARGLLPDVDRPVAAQLPGIGFDTPHNAPITWRHLLEQTSEWEGSCFGLPDQVDRWRKVAHDPRPAGGPKGGSRPLQAPGSYWEYNDVRINQLSLALLHLFREPLEQVMQSALLQPLGAQDSFRWEGYDNAWIMLDGRRLPSVPGGTHWGGGVMVSARDLARLGRLLLDGGMHQGRALLPADWVRRMGQPTEIAPFYGWLVWLNPEGRLFEGASARAMFMQGAGGHMVWVDPELQAVVVTRWLDPAHQTRFIAMTARALRDN